MIKNLFAILLITICYSTLYSQDTTKVIKNLGKRTVVANTHFSMQAPEHFNYSEKLKGFIHPGSAASIVITEAEGISWIQACQTLTAENLNGQNVSLLEQEEVQLKNGMKGKFFVMRITIASNDTAKQNMEFERLMLFTGDYNLTGWINANYPSMLRPVLYDILKESMLSVEMIDTPKPDEK
jgi:hypothetical protein